MAQPKVPMRKPQKTHCLYSFPFFLGGGEGLFCSFFRIVLVSLTCDLVSLALINPVARSSRQTLLVKLFQTGFTSPTAPNCRVSKTSRNLKTWMVFCWVYFVHLFSHDTLALNHWTPVSTIVCISALFNLCKLMSHWPMRTYFGSDVMIESIIGNSKQSCDAGYICNAKSFSKY